MLLTEGALVWPTLPADPPTDGTDPDLWAQAVTYAVDHCWAYSGRKFGVRDAVYRPQALDECGAPGDALGYLVATWGWAWAWQPNGTAADGRSGAALPGVLALPGRAVSVTDVTLTSGAGVTTVLPASAYRLDGNWLVRTDGQQWPLTQDLRANDGQPNTWHVNYKRGPGVPLAGQIAAGQLALEWLKKLRGDKSCILPWNVTSAMRGGVTITRDAAKLAKLTGIEATDRWIERVNPSGLQQPPTIWSPDLPRNGAAYAGSTKPYA